MKVSELIEALKKLPQDADVEVVHPGQCCCGECFLPQDEHVEPDPTLIGKVVEL